MLTLHVKELLKQKGYKPIPYLLTQWGIPQSAARRILYKEPKTIDLAVLECLCIFLRCTPNDLLHYTPDAHNTLAPDAPLHTITKTIGQATPIQLLKSANAEDIAELNTMIQAFLEKKKETP